MHILEKLINKWEDDFEKFSCLTAHEEWPAEIPNRVLYNSIMNCDKNELFTYYDKLEDHYKFICMLYWDGGMSRLDNNNVFMENIISNLYDILSNNNCFKFLHTELQCFIDMYSWVDNDEEYEEALNDDGYERNNINVDRNYEVCGEVKLKEGHWYYVKDKICIDLKKNPQTDEEKLLLFMQYGGKWLPQI